jgi:hypothetical protein
MTIHGIFCLLLALWLLISSALIARRDYRYQLIGITSGILGIGFLYLYIWVITSSVQP